MCTNKALLASVLGLSLLAAYPAHAAENTKAPSFKGHQFAGQEKISLEQARTIALNAYPGKITDEELEKERGGSGIRYSFDVQKGKVTHEVGIDAKTGKILENDLEAPNAD